MTRQITKLILLCFLILIIPERGIAQVYVLDLLEEEDILLGPENVSNDHMKLAPYYVAHLGNIKMEVIGLIKEELGLISLLEEKEKLKRKERKKVAIQ